MPRAICLLLTSLVWALVWGALSAASAHATLVSGHFEVTPARPTADAPMTLELMLEDPTQVPIQDAALFAELRPAAQSDAKPLRAEFTETAGVYRADATLEAPLRVGAPNKPQSFNFPPTATGAAGWRAWLIGLPVVAALLVTVLGLTRGDEKPQGAS